MDNMIVSNETNKSSILTNERKNNNIENDNMEVDNIETDNVVNNNESITQEITSATAYSSDLEKETEDNLLEEKDNKLNNEIDQKTDCLALTVRDNYQTLVIKNLFKKSARLSFKVALSVFAINFLNLFL